MNQPPCVGCAEPICSYDLDLGMLSNLMLSPFDAHPEAVVPGGLRAAHVNKILSALKKIGDRPRSAELCGVLCAAGRDDAAVYASHACGRRDGGGRRRSRRGGRRCGPGDDECAGHNAVDVLAACGSLRLLHR